jgi:hypothetical protein
MFLCYSSSHLTPFLTPLPIYIFFHLLYTIWVPHWFVK